MLGLGFGTHIRTGLNHYKCRFEMFVGLKLSLYACGGPLAKIYTE